MNCMKCGQEVKGGQVFCDACLESMESEPVNINTPVMIPVQPPKNPASHRRPVINPEEEVKRLNKLNQNLMLVLVLLFTTVLLLLIILFNQDVWEVVEDLGRNYSVAETATGG